MCFRNISFGTVVFVAFASAAHAASSKTGLIGDVADGSTLLRREVVAHEKECSGGNGKKSTCEDGKQKRKGIRTKIPKCICVDKKKCESCVAPLTWNTPAKSVVSGVNSHIPKMLGTCSTEGGGIGKKMPGCPEMQWPNTDVVPEDEFCPEMEWTEVCSKCHWKLAEVEKELGKKGYKLNNFLGSGGYGSVFEVLKTEPVGTFAAKVTKVITPNTCKGLDTHTCVKGYESNLVEGAKKEFDIMTALGPSGAVLKVEEKIEAVYPMTNIRQSYVILVMEKLEKDVLKYVVDLSPGQTKKQTTTFLTKLLHAIQAFHTGGYVHNDIKADNFGKTTDGRFVLLDFGASRKPKVEEKQAAEKNDFQKFGVMLGSPTFTSKFNQAGIEEFKKTHLGLGV